MDSNSYDFFPVIVGSGIVGLLLFLLFVVVGFVVSAFITSLWVRLILVFMRKALDRGYGRVRMASYGFDPGRPGPPAGPMPIRNGDGPRDW